MTSVSTPTKTAPLKRSTGTSGWWRRPDPFTAAADARRAAREARQLDPFETLGYEPTAKQREFHAATEYDILYGGAAGGGKSKALLMHGIRACVEHPGLRVGAFRRTYDELEESLLKELRAVAFAEALGARWNETKHELTFPHHRGSVIRFRYLESARDASRRQGGEYQLLLLDERTLLPPGVAELLMERLRSGNGLPVLGARCSSNPGGLSHAETKTRYIDATGYGTRIISDAQGTIRFIPARVDDNPHVDAGYKARLQAIPDPARRAAMLDGDWDQYEGQYFRLWRYARHVVPVFRLPAEWRRIIGIDFGYAAPWCVLWAAIDGDGRVWIYREIYATQVGERQQARRILGAEADGEHVAGRYGDPAMWAKSGDATPIALTYANEGVPLERADNDRVTGWQRVQTYLADGPACALHRAQGWTKCPMLHVLEGAAPNLVRTLPALPHDPNRVEDVDTRAEDHAADTLRYLLTSIGGEPGWLWDDRTETLAEQAGEPVLEQFGRYAADPSGVMSSPWG